MPYGPKRLRRKMRRFVRRATRYGRKARSYNPSNAWSSRTMQKLNARGSTRALTGFPEKMTVSLPYTIGARELPGAVAYVDTVFNLNNCFDPENSGVGHQPRAFDQWTLIYDKWRVSKTSINVVIRQRGSHGVTCRAVANNDSTNLGSDFNLGEFVQHTYLGTTSSNVRPIQRKLTYYPHKVMGMSWNQYLANEDTAGTASSSPSDMCFLHLVTQQTDRVTTGIDIEYEIQIVFRVTFYDRKNLAIS